MTPVHIIQGNTGEYEDRRSWVAGAFFNAGEAEEFLVKLKAIVQKHKIGSGVESYEVREDAMKELSVLDKNVDIDYTGVWYTTAYMEVK